MVTAENKWLTRRELAERWQLPIGTLADWASNGTGPRYARFGKHARYRLSDVVARENGQVVVQMNRRDELAAHLKMYGKMARYCGDADLDADCKALFVVLRDAKTVTGLHQQRAADLADRARQCLAEADVKSVIGGRPP